jgi:hypothetical protein
LALTKMKRAFIAAYCDDPKLGQAEAARKAGCSVKRAKVTAYEWMRDPEVKLEIQRQLNSKIGRVENQVGKRELTPESVIQDLDDISEMCKLAGAGAWQAATLVKIAELKGKYLKMFTERVEFAIDEKLIARLEAGRKLSGLSQLTDGSATVIDGDAQVDDSPAESANGPKRDTVQ